MAVEMAGQLELPAQRSAAEVTKDGGEGALYGGCHLRRPPV